MSVLYLKLADYFLPVAADCVDADIQLAGDLCAFHTGIYHRKDLTLSAAEYRIVP